jgi:hypothetical protein
MVESKPCRKFQKRLDDAVAFVAHVNEGKCKRCLELARYFERESRENLFLRTYIEIDVGLSGSGPWRKSARWI